MQQARRRQVLGAKYYIWCHNYRRTLAMQRHSLVLMCDEYWPSNKSKTVKSAHVLVARTAGRNDLKLGHLLHNIISMLKAKVLGRGCPSVGGRSHEGLLWLCYYVLVWVYALAVVILAHILT